MTSDSSAVLYDRLRELGHQSVRSYAAAHPGAPLGQLLSMLGKPVEGANHLDIPYLVLEEAYLQEAITGDAVRTVAMDLLVRSLREHLGRGWNLGKKAHLRRAAAFSNWRLPPDRDWDARLALARGIWNALKAQVSPDDWRPADTEDPLLERAFSAGWRQP